MSTVCNGNVMDGVGSDEGAVVLKDEADGVCIRIKQQIGKGGGWKRKKGVKEPGGGKKGSKEPGGGKKGSRRIESRGVSSGAYVCVVYISCFPVVT